MNKTRTNDNLRRLPPEIEAQRGRDAVRRTAQLLARLKQKEAEVDAANKKKD